ncbi:MAG: hypothetical protein C0403_09880 [Desulfobacterium sp.]|nr:hypothetical protein [Desulfobacterium sp.]
MIIKNKVRVSTPKFCLIFLYYAIFFFMIWKEDISGFFKREQVIVDKPFDKKYEFSVFNGDYDPSVPEFELRTRST